MRYEQPGTGTSAVEVTNVSQHGLRLLIGAQEVLLPFEQFPWFRDAPIGQVLHVELPSPGHLYWPELDVDLEVDSVLYPERYPLVSTEMGKGERYAAQKTRLEWDQDKVDDAVLALLCLTLHDGDRAWKGYDFDVMARLCEKGYLLDPFGKAKSVVLTDQGLARSLALFQELFGKR